MFFNKYNILCYPYKHSHKYTLARFQKTIFPLGYFIVRISGEVAAHKCRRRLIFPQPFVSNDFIELKRLHDITVFHIHPRLKSSQSFVIGAQFHPAQPKAVVYTSIALIPFNKTAVNANGAPADSGKSGNAVEKAAAEQATAEKAAAEKAAAEQATAEKAAAEKAAAEKAAAEQAAAEKKAAEKAAAEKKAAEQAAAEKAAAEKKAAEQAAAEKAAAEKAAAEKAEAERLAAEKAAAEQAVAEQSWADGKYMDSCIVYGEEATLVLGGEEQKVAHYHCNCGYSSTDYEEFTRVHMYQHVLNGDRNSYCTTYE